MGLRTLVCEVARKQPREDNKITSQDEWLIFARNRGDEGSCAQGVHFLDRNEFTFLLPAPQGGVVQQPTVTPHLNSNVAGLTWSAEGIDGGLLLTLKLATTSALSLEAVGVSGTIDVNWLRASQGPQSGDISPIVSVSKEGSQQASQKNNNGLGKSESYLLTVATYFKPVIGLAGDRQSFHDVAPIFTGVEADLFSTPLGAVHGDVSWARPRTITSANGSQYTAHATKWSTGLDIGLGLAGLPSLFGEISGGQINRSADPKIRTSKPFDHFYGKDATFGYGLGYTFHQQGRFSFRAFVGDLYIPGTSDHSFRLNLSPQFRVRAEK